MSNAYNMLVNNTKDLMYSIKDLSALCEINQQTVRKRLKLWGIQLDHNVIYKSSSAKAGTYPVSMYDINALRTLYIFSLIEKHFLFNNKRYDIIGNKLYKEVCRLNNNTQWESVEYITILQNGLDVSVNINSVMPSSINVLQEFDYVLIIKIK